jgi:hypothetical protein
MAWMAGDKEPAMTQLRIKLIGRCANLTASQISSRFLGFLACVANASTPWTSLQCLRDCDNQYAV